MKSKTSYGLSYSEASQLSIRTYPEAGNHIEYGSEVSKALADYFCRKGFMTYGRVSKRIFLCGTSTAYQLGVMAGKRIERSKRHNDK